MTYADPLEVLALNEMTVVKIVVVSRVPGFTEEMQNSIAQGILDVFAECGGDVEVRFVTQLEVRKE